MKVLAIIGSPRKGNSYQLTRKIEQHLTKDPDIEFEYVFLSLMNLHPCRGCYNCITRGEQHCPLKDDRENIVQKMRQADGVIFVSPVYTLNVSGLMKNFMDRIAYNSHRPPFIGKPALLVTTTAGLGVDSTLNALSWFAIMGFRIVAKIGIVVYPQHQNAPAHQKNVDKQIEKAARRFENALQERPSQPPLVKIIQFQALKANAMFGRNVYLADHAYYKEKENYHLDVEVSWWKRLLGKFFYRMSTQWMNQNFVPLQKDGIPGT
jgi:multimeric flavodoxin WrbA